MINLEALQHNKAKIYRTIVTKEKIKKSEFQFFDNLVAQLRHTRKHVTQLSTNCHPAHIIHRQCIQFFT